MPNPDLNPYRAGFTKPAFSALKLHVQDQKKEGKPTICTLLIDETDIFYRDEYAEGEFHGFVELDDEDYEGDDEEAGSAMVLMLVSVNQSWEIPVAYYLIRHLSNEDIASRICKCLHMLNDIEVTVIALSCSWLYNERMLQVLGANLDINNMRPCFPHPANPDQSVHVVFDIPMMLRHVWLTLAHQKVFRTATGEIKWQYMKELVKLDRKGLQLPDHLKMGILNRRLRGKKLTEEELSEQVFCTTVADALQYFSEELHLPQFQGSEETVQFIRLVRQMAEVLTSRNPLAKGSKAPMKATNKEELRSILQSAETYLLGLMDGDSKAMHAGRWGRWIRQLLSSCRSIWNVCEELVHRDGAPCRFLFTNKLNLDPTKHFFSALREEVGGHSASAWEFKKFYRSFIRILVKEGKGLTGANPYLMHPSTATMRM